MKRFLLFSLGIFVSSGLGLMAGRVTYALSSSEDLLSLLFSKAEVEESDSKDVKELEGLAEDGDQAFQNLYLFMFQNVVKGPQESALEELATRLKEKKRTGYDVDDLREIVVHGSLVPILERHDLLAQEAMNADNLQSQEEAQAEADAEYEAYVEANPSTGSLEGFTTWYYTEYAQPDVLTAEDVGTPTQAEILAEYQYLLNLYEQELQLQTDYRKVSYEALATEMFYNGDLGDSAKVDLLYDLDLAYLLLFGEPIVFPDRTGTDSVELSSEEEDLVLEQRTTENNSVLPNSPVILSEDSVNPYTCYEDESIQSALDDFYAEQTTNPSRERSVPESIIYPSLSGDGSEENPPSGTNPREEVDEALQRLDTMLTLMSGPTGDWTRSLPCGDVFCITIDLIEENEDPTVEYEESDNCILCHLSYINDRMNQTVNSSLAASKVSMNWFEEATCNEAGTIDLDFNVFTVAMPIELDPGDDIDEAPAQAIENLKNTLVSIGAIPLPDGKTEYTQTLEELGCESILNLQDIAGQATALNNAITDCIVESARIESEVVNAIDESLFEVQQANATTLYEQVAAELSRMLILFRNMQDGFQATYLVEDAPIPSLVSKRYCQ